MQDLWKSKVDWDAPLSDDLQQTWNNLAEDINTVTTIEFQRQLLKSQSYTEHEKATYLHVFVDASIHSYGAAAYICNDVESRLVMSRNRVAPLKTLTLSQLELMAALVGARLATHLQDTLKTTHTTFWSDSQIVLHWLSTSKPLKRFVINRVTEIRTLTDVSSWLYCPTHDNPADLVTRGIGVSKFLQNDLWFKGPAWLCYPKKWPTWKGSSLVLQTLAEEEKTQSTSFTKTETSVIVPVIDFGRHSRYSKYLRITAYIMRFAINCKKQRNDRKFGQLTARDLEQAEKMIIRNCQRLAFPEVMSELRLHRKTQPLIRQLSLYLDPEGLIRCGERIKSAPVENDAKFPLLLPKKHLLTCLIVRDAHHRNKYSGVNRTATRSSGNVQLVAKFKEDRTTPLTPTANGKTNRCTTFHCNQLDFTGALFIRQPDRKEEKVYICLFTCANTRAVHLEVVTSLSEESFIHAFRRFTSRKSLPKTVISDNATTFQAASNHLKKLFESESINATFSDMGVDLQFIPKRAPWYGGFCERLIGITKTALKKTLGRAYVNLDTLHTVITEIEALINDRPLTFVSASIEDGEPLTPSHLLYGRRLTSLPHSNTLATGNVTSTRADLQNHAQRLRYLIEQYWSRWRSEYLTSLREFHRKSGRNTQTISPGEVVLVHNDTSRSSLKLAIIGETLPGPDGLVRTARIRTKNGQCTTRPIVKLYPLEVLSDSKFRK